MKKSELKAIIKEEIQKEAKRAPLNTLIQMVVSGTSKDVEGTKLTKANAKKLMNLYNSNFVDKKTFNKSTLPNLIKTIKSFGIDM